MPSRSERRVTLGLLSPSGVRLFSRVRLFSPSKGKIVVTGLGVLVGGAAGVNVGTPSVLAGEEAGGVGVRAGGADGAESGMKRGEGAILSSIVGTVGDESVMVGVVLGAFLSSSAFSFSFSFSRSFSLSLSFSFSRSFSARAASRSGRMRSAIEVFLTFPSGAPSLLAPRPARTFLKAKKSPNFFLMFFVGAAEGVEVVKVVV